MAGLGFLLLLCVRGKNPSLVHLLILSGALAAANQAAKALPLRFLPADAQLPRLTAGFIRHPTTATMCGSTRWVWSCRPARQIFCSRAAPAVSVRWAAWFARECRIARADVKLRLGAALPAAGAVCLVAATILLGYVRDFIVIPAGAL